MDHIHTYIQFAEEMSATSEKLTGRIESFRETTGAVSGMRRCLCRVIPSLIVSHIAQVASFLQSKNSRVDEAIRRSKRQGKTGEDGQQRGGAGGVVADKSGIALLSDHLAPVKC